MRKISSFLAMLLLTFLSLGNVAAQNYVNDLTSITASPANGSADVWYHIVLPVRTWGIWSNSGVNNSSQSSRGFYYDQGAGKMLINVEDTLDVPGTRWKFVATATADRYQLISGLGNTIDCSPYADPIGTEGQPGYIPANRVYTTTPGTQYVTISTRTNGDLAIAGLTLTRSNGAGGVDKAGGDLGFGANYGPDAVGGAVLFRPVSGPLTGVYLNPPADLDFGEVPAGKARTKALNVTGVNLSGNLSWSIAGDGFAVTNQSATTATGGSADITFSPTERKVYTAVLTISIGDKSVTVNLTGNSNFNFPLQISNGNTEYWYYIQFDRQAVNNKVIQANEAYAPVTQARILGGEAKQQWKIVGDWDTYRIVSKSGDGELGYSPAINKYVLDDEDYGSEFGFERFKDTDDWQLRDLTYGYLEGGVQSETRRYLNDLKGDSVANYTPDDDGDRLIFIPATTRSLLVGTDEVDFGSAPGGIGAAITKAIPVGGLGTTAAINAVIEGSSVFALKSASLPAAGGAFEVTFTPTGIDLYQAKLILSSTGMTNDTVLLKARGSAFPFKLSGTTEHWYYIQFMRQSSKALTSKGLGEKVLQELWTAEQAVDDNQLWKITGTWDNFKFVSKKGGELFSEPTTDEDGDPTLDKCKLVASGSGDTYTAVEKTTGTNQGWGFKSNKALTDLALTLYLNDHEASEVGLYSVLDDGGPLKFIPASGVIILPNAASVNYGNITVGLKGEKILTVTATNTTAEISYVLSGTNSSAFTITNTTASATDGTLPKEGGTLKISFDPIAIGEYIAVLTLSSTGAENVVIPLNGNCVAEDLPVSISNQINSVWYTVAFNRTYTSADSWKVWTAGLETEAITQTAHAGRENPEFTKEEQLWKFVVNPEKTAYVAVAYNGLVAKFPASSHDANLNYVTAAAEEGATPLTFLKNSGGKWYLKHNAHDRALNDRSGTYVCQYSSDGNDNGCPMTFIETTPPDPVRIDLNTSSIDFGRIEPGAPALYSSNIIAKGVQLTGDISLAISGEGASAYSVVRAADSTAVAAVSGTDTLKVIFNPAAVQEYAATLTFTAEGAETKVVTLNGSGLKLPVKPSTATEPVWYYIGFVRQSTLFDPPKAYTKVLTADADTLRQVEKAIEEQAVQLWRFDGSAASGYRLVNKAAGAEAAYDSTSTVKSYLMQAEGDRFSFESGTGDNSSKIQLRNRTNTANGSFLCDKENKGFYALNYFKNDAGNWLFFIPQIPTAIDVVEAEINDPVISGAYYNLQGARVQRAVPGNVYIRIDTHASGKTTATKIFLVK